MFAAAGVPHAQRPKPDVWEAITALEQHGYAYLIWYDAPKLANPYAVVIASVDPVHLPPTPIPLAHVAYDDERGVYDTRLIDPASG
ncbi:MAG TPA: hypothetical protein VID73_12320 [Ktedonobacterales bacterium]